jgi:hypothetical protein
MVERYGHEVAERNRAACLENGIANRRFQRSVFSHGFEFCCHEEDGNRDNVTKVSCPMVEGMRIFALHANN